MPSTKKKSRPTPKPALSAPPVIGNDSGGEVLTLPEAAAYLRLPEAGVRQLVEEQGLPARQLGEDWRFLKSAIQTWLSAPRSKESKKDIWSVAGSLKDDPYLEDMLKEIDRMRGRPTTEEG
ncbi:MAG TPA: helix-turn-helix domain-containing protein [Gemmataceae bacterium]|nr:helix-turn-helix domain-containing protein [Gemmataceae bacterium]